MGRAGAWGKGRNADYDGLKDYADFLGKHWQFCWCFFFWRALGGICSVYLLWLYEPLGPGFPLQVLGAWGACGLFTAIPHAGLVQWIVFGAFLIVLRCCGTQQHNTAKQICFAELQNRCVAKRNSIILRSKYASQNFGTAVNCFNCSAKRLRFVGLCFCF